jgi:hypothetical protein
MQAASGLSLDQIVRFDVDLAMGGENITMAELEALAKLKAPLVKLRGHTREELVSGMKVPAAPAGPVPTLPGEPLPADPTVFWHGAPVPEDLYLEVQIPQVHAALPKRLGHFPFWRSELDAAVAPVFSSLLLESKGNGLPAAVSAPHYWHIEKTGNKYAKLLTYVSSSRYYMYRSIY